MTYGLVVTPAHKLTKEYDNGVLSQKKHLGMVKMDPFRWRETYRFEGQPLGLTPLFWSWESMFFKTWGNMLKYDIMWWEERRETACGFWILGTVGILRCLQAKEGLGRACQVRWELPGGEQICQIEEVETKSSTLWAKICMVVKKPAWLRKKNSGWVNISRAAFVL